MSEKKFESYREYIEYLQSKGVGDHECLQGAGITPNKLLELYERIDVLEDGLKEIIDCAEEGDCFCELGDPKYHATSCPVAIAGIAHRVLGG